MFYELLILSLTSKKENMEKFESLITNRRSIRKFTDEPLAPEDVQKILQSALVSPTSKNCKSWEFVAVEDKNMLQRLSLCKSAGGAFIGESALSVVVLGDMTKTDVWVEDASIAATFMQLQAEDLGLGSCWCHIRNRFHSEISSEEYVRELLNIPEHFGVLCIISVGHKGQERKPYDLSDLPWEKVHIEKFSPENEIYMA